MKDTSQRTLVDRLALLLQLAQSSLGLVPIIGYDFLDHGLTGSNAAVLLLLRDMQGGIGPHRGINAEVVELPAIYAHQLQLRQN